jgi:polyisoprenyl-teichoic acid--peptidoglycan teichoic acid transferase
MTTDDRALDDLRSLDDPQPFVPDDELRDAAHARGRTLVRRRRARFGAIGAVATVLVLVVGFSSYQTWRSSKVVRIDLAANLDPRESEAAPDVDDDAPVPPSQALNILVVGSDQAMPGEGREQVTDVRTDTMMVVRADPDAGTIGVLSLPRDLWVDIPDHGQERLNTAWETGGPALLIDTIKANLDIPINHFLQVDGEGFQKLVDQAGGATIWVSGELRDDNTGFAAGGPACVDIDGAQALALVRSRHLERNEPGRGWVSDPYGDLSRIQRQQIMGRVFAASLVEQDLGITAMNGLLDTLIENAVLDADWGLRDMAGLLGWAQELDLDTALTMATPPVRDQVLASGAAVLFLEEAAAEPILAQFRPASAGVPATDAPAVGTTGGTGGAAAPSTTTTTTPATVYGSDWVLSAPPDGSSC